MPTVDEANRLVTWEELEFRERKLKEREAFVAQRERELSAMPPVRDAQAEAAVQAAQQTVAARCVELDGREHEALVKASDLDAQSKTLLARERAVTVTAGHHAVRQEALDAQDDDLRVREAAVAERHRQTEELSRNVSLRSQAVDHAEAALRTATQDAARGQADTQARLALQQEALRNAALAATQAQEAAVRTLEEARSKLDRKASEVEAQAHAIGERERTVARSESDVRTREAVVQATQEAQDKEASRLVSFQRANDLREMQLEKRERQVKQLIEQHQLKKELEALPA